MEDVFVNSLVDVRAARAEIRLSDTEVVPMLRLDLFAQRQDLSGRHPPFALPSLWMETKDVEGLIQALRSALARLIPEHTPNPEQGQDEASTTPPIH